MEGGMWLKTSYAAYTHTYGALQVKGPVERTKGHAVATTSSLMQLQYKRERGCDSDRQFIQ